MQNKLINKKDLTYKKTVEMQKEIAWQHLSNISLIDAANCFFESLSPHTRRTYETSFNMFFRKRLLTPTISLQELSLYNLESLIDMMKAKVEGSEATKQTRVACFVSFTGFLARRTKGMIRKAIPSKDNGSTTFKKIRRYATTEALNERDLNTFLRTLKELNYRDFLIAKTTVQGAKRVEEVLSAKISQIDWGNNKITFKQSKSRDLEQITIIHYPEYFIKELKEYVADKTKEDLIFTTRTGVKVTQPHLFRSFVGASIKAELDIKVTPHVLRASAVTILINKGFNTQQVMKVSGHVTPSCVSYYDKSPIEKNITQEVALI
ncbi:MAG: Tyrosine recombinase XerC [Candidatus Anoxychlamydiales bacterium]|nr:Tyrosine recombinase XerC [Candidatus Anoxychlamydiales bacterium]